MRDFGAYAIAVAIVLSVLCCANFALASQTTPPVSNNTAAIGTAPVGDDLSLVDVGGFLRLVGGFFRIGITGGSTADTPAVSLTAPSSGADVSGSSVTLTAFASDDVGIQSVQFQIDGTNLGSAITSAPYTTTWNSTGVSDGTHTITAIVTNVVGAQNSATKSVTVENTPVSLSSISATSSYTTATSTWTTNEPATSEVLIGPTTSYGTTYYSATLGTSHSIALSGLTASSTYHYIVVSTNAVGNTATSSDQTFTTAAPVTEVIFLTSTTTTTWTVPSNWNSASNTIELVGGGGGGALGNNSVYSGSGGGGGAYAKITDETYTPE